jgi:hydroxymethylpyrimidine/phosphomethylpyrimidine kinase
MKRVLTIAGSDSSGGAGIQADNKVFAELGVYGLTAITSVTAQNSTGVQKVFKVAPRTIAAQIDSVARDIGCDACKIGMLYSHQVVDLVAERIHRREIPNVVLDPIIFAKGGVRLLTAKAVGRMRRNLLPRVMLVAPNVPEAEILSGIQINDSASAAAAAEKIWECGCKYVLIKGGHLEGDPDDLLFDGENVRMFSGKRIEGEPMRGTGCVLTAAIAANLALGADVPEAVEAAKVFVTHAIADAVKLGKGQVTFYSGTGQNPSENTEGRRAPNCES